MGGTREKEEVLKARGMKKLGYVLLTNSGLGPFWYGVWGDKNGTIFFNSDWGLEEWNLECHGNILTEEEMLEAEMKMRKAEGRTDNVKLGPGSESKSDSSDHASPEDQRMSDGSVKKLKDIRKRLEDAAKELDEIVTEEDGRIDEAVAANQDIENDWEDMIYDIRDAIEEINSVLDTLPDPD